MNSQKWKARIGQLEQGEQEKDRQKRDRQNGTGRSRLSDRTAWKGLPGQDCKNRAARTRLSARNC
jgi:hypothetical protein